MCLVAFCRYLNFYGQRGTRLTNDQTIYGYLPKRTYLIKVLSIFFFYAPELHLRGTCGRHALLLYIENLLNRTGIRLHGFPHLSAQVAIVHYKAAVRLVRIHPIRGYPSTITLQCRLRILF